jgi:hypothetical protein
MKKRENQTEIESIIIIFSSSSFSTFHLPVVEIDDLVCCILARIMIAPVFSFT